MNYIKRNLRNPYLLSTVIGMALAVLLAIALHHRSDTIIPNDGEYAKKEPPIEKTWEKAEDDSLDFMNQILVGQYELQSNKTSISVSFSEDGSCTMNGIDGTYEMPDIGTLVLHIKDKDLAYSLSFDKHNNIVLKDDDGTKYTLTDK